ncbi:hypothetical protein ACJMK2_004468 [Sinanodonta woodiana]|uniref:Uncharacterized protein n=1 Tax=Sinanodonta woodiana TaxID=1069815 RepID=A0ABD3Y3C5_SINWO
MFLKAEISNIPSLKNAIIIQKYGEYKLYSFQIKMRLASLTVIILCILMAPTDGRQCWYRFGRCIDKGDLRGKCGDVGGVCNRVTGTTECRCNSPLNAFGIDEFRGT